MCDIRTPPNKVIIKETGEIKDITIVGRGVNTAEITNPQFGLYHIGASGCGYLFYDGTKWNNIDTTIEVEVWGQKRYMHIEAETEEYRFQRPIQIYNYNNLYGPSPWIYK